MLRFSVWTWSHKPRDESQDLLLKPSGQTRRVHSENNMTQWMGQWCVKQISSQNEKWFVQISIHIDWTVTSTDLTTSTTRACKYRGAQQLEASLKNSNLILSSMATLSLETFTSLYMEMITWGWCQDSRKQYFPGRQTRRVHSEDNMTKWIGR